jgi:hypothetical protein
MSARSNKKVVCSLISLPAVHKADGSPVAYVINCECVDYSTVELMVKDRYREAPAGRCCVYVVDTVTTAYGTRVIPDVCLFHVRGFNYQSTYSVHGQSAAMFCNTDQLNSLTSGTRSSRVRLPRPSTSCWATKRISFGKGCSNVSVHLYILRYLRSFIACLNVPYFNNNFKSFSKQYVKLYIKLKLSLNDLFENSPLIFAKKSSPYFFMEHLLQGLYGV